MFALIYQGKRQCSATWLGKLLFPMDLIRSLLESCLSTQFFSPSHFLPNCFCSNLKKPTPNSNIFFTQKRGFLMKLSLKVQVDENSSTGVVSLLRDAKGTNQLWYSRRVLHSRDDGEKCAKPIAEGFSDVFVQQIICYL